jgi:hypothetical protein
MMQGYGMPAMYSHQQQYAAMIQQMQGPMSPGISTNGYMGQGSSAAGSVYGATHGGAAQSILQQQQRQQQQQPKQHQHQMPQGMQTPPHQPQQQSFYMQQRPYGLAAPHQQLSMAGMYQLPQGGMQRVGSRGALGDGRSPIGRVPSGRLN